MTDPFAQPGHGPADPSGYLIEESGDGYRWTRLADRQLEDGFATREEAVISAEADRTA